MSTTHPERTWTGPGAPERLAILRRTRSIAIVGASDKPARASYFVATYLLSSTTYDVYFVNPVLAAAGKKILGHRVYASLDDLEGKVVGAQVGTAYVAPLQADDKLKAVFGKDRFTMFEMNAILSDHLTDA